MAAAQALVHDVVGALLYFAHAPALLLLLGPLASWPRAELGLVLLLLLLRLVQDEVQLVLVRVRVVAAAARQLILVLRLRLGRCSCGGGWRCRSPTRVLATGSLQP